MWPSTSCPMRCKKSLSITLWNKHLYKTYFHYQFFIVIFRLCALLGLMGMNVMYQKLGIGILELLHPYWIPNILELVYLSYPWYFNSRPEVLGSLVPHVPLWDLFCETPNIQSDKSFLSGFCAVLLLRVNKWLRPTHHCRRIRWQMDIHFQCFN